MVKVLKNDLFQLLLSGPEECHDKTIPSTMVKPEEMCDLQPATDCRIVTNLVPHLVRQEICETVPKEFCHMKLDQPKLVTKPVRIKWCTFAYGAYGAYPASGNLPEGSEPAGNLSDLTRGNSNETVDEADI